MRLIYADEAGISAKEPRCVVAAVLVEPDKQFRLLERALGNVFDEHVPGHLREGFVFHATEIFSGGKSVDRQSWPFEDRLYFLKSVLCLPFVQDIPIAFSIIDKSWKVDIPNVINYDLFCHTLAFTNCMERADLFLRKYLNGAEIGVVISEDVPQHRQVLSKVGLAFRANRLTMPSEMFRQDMFQTDLGLLPDPHTNKIDHIIDEPHFIEKGKAPMLQLADACAFAIRRWVNRLTHGDDLMLAMAGPVKGPLLLSDPIWFDGPHSALINTESYWNDEQKAASALLLARWFTLKN